jgi:hypothetical protein
LSRDAVVDSDEAEGEDDGWEDDEWDDESEPWSYANLATPVSKNQVAMDSVIAFRVTSEFWFGSVVVLDVSGTHDDDASAEEATPATNFARPANGSDKTIAASPTRTTKDDLGEGESSAPETDVRTDREAQQPSGGDETVTSESPAKTGPENLVAATASPVEEKAAENLDRKDAVSPTALSTRTTQDDGTLASPDEETQSQTASRTKAGSSSERLEMSSRRVDGPQRHPLIAEASVSRHTLRHAESPPSSYQGQHARIFAALAPESSGTHNGRLRDALSQDLAALETALQDLLADSGEMGKDMAEWLTRPDVIPWTLAATIALVAAEIVRRKTQRSRSNGLPPPPDAADVSLRLFPELLGLPPGTRP